MSSSYYYVEFDAYSSLVCAVINSQHFSQKRADGQAIQQKITGHVLASLVDHGAFWGKQTHFKVFASCHRSHGDRASGLIVEYCSQKCFICQLLFSSGSPRLVWTWPYQLKSTTTSEGLPLVLRPFMSYFIKDQPHPELSRSRTLVLRGALSQKLAS